MEKEFIQSNNYYVAETMNDEPLVEVNNFVDIKDGGFKISTAVVFPDQIMIVEKTFARSLKENGKERKSPDYRIYEINLEDKKWKKYEIKQCKTRELNEEEIEYYGNLLAVNKEETIGQA